MCSATMMNTSTMYSAAQQQLACLMELRQFQQSNFNRSQSTSPNLYYTQNQSQIISNRPTASKAFTIDAILGLHNNNNNENSRLKPKNHSTAGIVASFAAACRRNAVLANQESKGCEVKHKSTSSSGVGKSKRVRTIFTPEQLERLEAEFERQQYMVGPERLYLASALHLTEAQVKVWFQNRRIKWRKQHLEIQQQRLAAIKQQQQQMQVHDEESMSETSSTSETPD